MPNTVDHLIKQIKIFLEQQDAEVLVSTSRRTSTEVERLIRQGFADYKRCKLLVIANDNNIPEAVGGILGLSDIIVVSPESISMISEAASSGKHVVVFASGSHLGRRHNSFIRRCAQSGYIHLTEIGKLSTTLRFIAENKPLTVTFGDRQIVRNALHKIL